MNMQRNRYLEEIGLKRNFYGNNFLLKDKYSFKYFLERRHYGFDFIDILNFDFTVYQWIYSHLTVFIEYCNDSYPEGIHCALDLSCHSVEFEGRTYTIREAVAEGFAHVYDVDKNGINEEVCKMKKESENNYEVLYNPTEKEILEEDNMEALEYWYEEVLSNYDEIDKCEVFDKYDN